MGLLPNSKKKVILRKREKRKNRCFEKGGKKVLSG